jgi:hypothetical protein
MSGTGLCSYDDVMNSQLRRLEEDQGVGGWPLRSRHVPSESIDQRQQILWGLLRDWAEVPLADRTPLPTLERRRYVDCHR